MVSVASWAHRALRGIPRYHHCHDEPEYCQPYASWAPEQVVGVYENPQPAEPSSIVITEKGMYWVSAGVNQGVEFGSVRDVRGPDEKATAAELKLHLVDGSTWTIRIEGGDGKYRDVYSFVRFLDRVIELKRMKRRAERPGD